MKTITSQNAKSLHNICAEHRVEMPICVTDERVCSFCEERLGTQMICKSCNKRDVINKHINKYTTNELLEWIGNGVTLKSLHDKYQACIRINDNDTVTNALTPQDSLCLLVIKLINDRIIK